MQRGAVVSGTAANEQAIEAPILTADVGADVSATALAAGTAVPVAPVDGMAGADGWEWKVKWALDVVFAVIALCLLAPVFLAIALCIRLTTGGPALYRSVRVGRGRVPFEMLKFRTMHLTADELRAELGAGGDGELFKLPGDPRITTVGRLLRRTSLDELPQIINVVRGEMSFVGPRPLIPEEDRLIGGLGQRRLSILPGITGPWQACGRARPSLGEMVSLDCGYASRWSPAADARIIARTLWHMVRLDGM